MAEPVKSTLLCVRELANEAEKDGEGAPMAANVLLNPLRQAMLLERQSLEFYTQQAEASGDESVREFFRELGTRNTGRCF